MRWLVLMVVCVGLVLSTCGYDSGSSNGGLVCGPDTHEENGVCVINQDDGTSTDIGTDIGTDTVEDPDVSQTALLIEACVTVETAEGTDCSEELVVDWGSVVPGDGTDGDIELTNIGSSNARLIGIAWLSGGEVVDSPFFSASVFSNGQPAGDLPVPIDQNETLQVNVALLPGLAPGALPVDSVALTVSDDNGDEQSIVVSLVGSVSECGEGTGNCDGDWFNGCETDTITSQEHCGACDNPCTVVHGTSACETGLCVVACDDGWGGAVCDTNIDECATQPNLCDVNATCSDTEGGFECACNAGFEGDGIECTDLDECALLTDNCSDNALCTNAPSSFWCECNSGYSGDGVTCTNIDECATATNNCGANAACSDSEGNFVCTCNAGYEGDGVSCSDLDECTLGIDGCDANATCSNIVGSFSCACNAGYEGDGVSCTDLDECTLGTDGCDANATCSNNVGSFACACNTGYEGDGVSCADIDECTTGTHNCHLVATCTNTPPGGFTCTCPLGYVDQLGDGTLCVDETPDAFAFTDQTDAPVSTPISSNIIKITGIDSSISISIAGDVSAEYRVCGDATCSTDPEYSNAAGTIDNNQYVQLRMTSGASPGTLQSTTLSIGAVSDQWDVTSATCTSGSQTFNFTDTNQTFTVPLGCTTIQVTLKGAGGGKNTLQPALACPTVSIGGTGGSSTHPALPVTGGETLQVLVGGKGADGVESQASTGGFGGGGTAQAGFLRSGGGGGGRSAIVRAGTDLINAAGGGGASGCGSGYPGGNGGGLTGQAGLVPGAGYFANPGTQTAGGIASCGGTGNGSFHLGGSCTTTNGGHSGGGSGGGGGGGHYGGAGAGYNSGVGASGGAGGSSLVPAGGSTVLGGGSPSSTHGQVIISWSE